METVYEVFAGLEKGAQRVNHRLFDAPCDATAIVEGLSWLDSALTTLKGKRIRSVFEQTKSELLAFDALMSCLTGAYCLRATGDLTRGHRKLLTTAISLAARLFMDFRRYYVSSKTIKVTFLESTSGGSTGSVSHKPEDEHEVGEEKA